MEFPLHTPLVQVLPEVESQLQLKNVITKQKQKKNQKIKIIYK